MVQKDFGVRHVHHLQDSKPLMFVSPPGQIKVPLQVPFPHVIVNVGHLIASFREASVLLLE